MGLASKLAAANPQGFQGGPGAQPQGQQQGTYPGQQSYQAYPGAPGAGPPSPRPPYTPSGGSASPHPPPTHSPYPPSPDPSQYGSSSPYPRSGSGYNRPPPPPPPGQGHPSQPPYPQQPYGQQSSWGQPQSPHPPFGQQNQWGQQQSRYQTPQQQWNQPYGQPGAYPPHGAPPGQPPQGQYGQPPSGRPPPGQPPQGQYGYPPQGPPPQGQYGYPPQGPPPQGQYGYPPQGPPPQGQHGYPPQGPPPYGAPGGYGAPQQASQADVAAYKNLLMSCVNEKKLQHFYPPNSQQLDQIANRAPALINQVCTRWNISKELANDVIKLALYDIILFIDDSGSMSFHQDGRLEDMKLILNRVSFAATLFDTDGIAVRAFNTDLSKVPDRNSNPLQDHVTSQEDVDELMSKIKFSSLTPIGTELRKKIIDQLVLPKAASGQLQKPVLIITITDGEPTDGRSSLPNTIKYAFETLKKYPQYGTGALAFEIAQVGNDEKARKFLGEIDEDPTIGPMVDCTSNFESENEEMNRKNIGISLTPDVWLMKLLLGAIDSSYDSKDETSGPGPGPAGGFARPPQAPPGQHAPPGYGGQQSPYPPQGSSQGYYQYPPQQQYGGPPPGPYAPGQPQGGPPPGPGGYPGQQQYGQPPPPQQGRRY